MPGIRVPGHCARATTSSVACDCGWSASAATKRARRLAYSIHLGEARGNRQRRCRDCGETFDEKRMSRHKPNLCKPCATARTKAWAHAHPEAWERHRRRSWLKRKYGITPEDYDRILAEQGGVCAICGTPPTDSRGFRMHVDHDHRSGRVRGILCGPCNQGLGNFGDDAERLAAARDYLVRVSS